ncbi:FUSC family protein [Streptomyces sp. HMX87]|uniref:FUSC family protein n=1 Tax=Streptomyces sp. HMX87 TaxID=3390849 RepID=UPI003A8BB449
MQTPGSRPWPPGEPTAAVPSAGLPGTGPPAAAPRWDTAGWADATRATVAAGVSWQVCDSLLHQPQPYSGALAALLVVETTVVGTAASAARYAAGCLIGAVLAVPAALLGGPDVVGLGLIVFVCVLTTRRGFLGHHGLHVPMTALLTFALVRGRHTAELSTHVTEIAVGIVVGLASSALLLPAVRIRPAEYALDRLRSRLAGCLDELARAVDRGERPQDVLGPDWRSAVGEAVAEARTAVREAHESMRWNVRPVARRRRWHLDHCVLGALAEVAEHVCAMGRLLDERPARESARSPGPDGHSRTRWYARLLRTTAVCVYDCRGGRPHPALPPARRALGRLHTAHAEADGPGPGRGTAPDPGPGPGPGVEDALLCHLDAILTGLASAVPATSPEAPSRPAPHEHHA